MGYERDRRIEQQARRRASNCIGCRDLERDGISFADHTCGRRFLTAREAGLHGADFDRLQP